jgi:hypothetical protein
MPSAVRLRIPFVSQSEGPLVSGHSFTWRAVIAACAAFALAGHAALAQSGQVVRNIRVDVAPLRANAGDPTAT